MRRTTILAFTIVATCQNLAWAQFHGPARVVLDKADMRDMPDSMTLVATVFPARQSMIGSEMEGIVSAMPARQGDRVEKGQVLCQLDDSLMRLRVAEATARLQQLQARLDELQAGARKQELRRARAVYEEASAEEERWRFEFDRVTGLFAGKDSNAKEYRDTVSSYNVAQRRTEAAAAMLSLAEEGPRAEVLAQAQYDVAAQQAVVQQMQRDQDRMAVRAPYTGYVSRRTAEVGQWVSTGDTVVELIELDHVLVRVDVPEHALPYIQVDQPSRVLVNAVGRSFVGTVKHIVRQADMNARTFPVEIAVENPDGVLAGGMFAKATVRSGAASQAVTVPKDAVVERSGSAYVTVITPGPQGNMGVPTQVSLGADVGKRVAVTSGNIMPGSEVVVRGNEGIMIPTPVLVVDEHGTPVPERNAPPPGGGGKAGGAGGSEAGPGGGAAKGQNGSTAAAPSSGREESSGA